MTFYDCACAYAQVDVSALNDCASVIGLVTFAELSANAATLNIPSNVLSVFYTDDTTQHASFDGYDAFLMSIPNLQESLFNLTKIGVYFSKARLIFVCDSQPKYIAEAIDHGKTQNAPAPRVLCWVFEAILRGDVKAIQAIESDLMLLDDHVSEDIDADYIKTVAVIRKKLVFLKQYYEQMLDVVTNVEEDENDLINATMHKYMSNSVSRASGLLQSTINLREYLAQIRDAYQAQSDIRLNEIMRVFTVIATIFLPLTLITSWYGMNLQMPETEIAFAYPLIIVAMVVIAVGCVVYFRRKKWM